MTAAHTLPSGVVINKITEKLSVSGQPDMEDLSTLKALGFRAIVACRPDGEDSGQAPAEALRQKAEQMGLAFDHIPVISGGITQSDIDRFAICLDDLPGPVFAYCRTGTRIAKMWAMGQADAAATSPEQIISAASAAGYDLSTIRDDLDRRAQGGSQ